jgi:hypothetical protein
MSIYEKDKKMYFYSNICPTDRKMHYTVTFVSKMMD